MIEQREITPFTLPAEHQTLIDVLHWRAKTQPDRQAYIFLADGEKPEIPLTYAELDRQARLIGQTLQSRFPLAERALLLYPAGCEYITAFFGCLYAGIIAVPAYPPHSNRSLHRIQSIVDDAQVKVTLTTEAFLAKSGRWFTAVPELAELQWIATDNLQATDEEWTPGAIQPEHLAFLQYTSGSTSTPKGVMVSHSNLMHNSSMIQGHWGQNEESVGVSWLPVFHDMGLILGVLQALYAGYPAILMSPAAFLQRPLRWLQAITRYGATNTCAPNFAYELCAQRITPEERAELDLSTLQFAVTGAEPIRLETLQRFAEVFAPCGFKPDMFYPAYGLAEGTLLVSAKAAGASVSTRYFDKIDLKQNILVEVAQEDPEGQCIIGCGSAEAGQKIVIVNPETLEACGSDEVGEIWVSGPSVAQGYWQRPEESEQTFRAYLAGTGEGPFLRTGDFGFLQQNEVFITGRLKDLIIIRGQNHYPQDIERTTALSHPSLRIDSSAAFSIEVASGEHGAASGATEERLVIVQEVLRHYDDVNDIFAAIRQAVAEAHELEVYAIVLIKYGSILKTSSGKIQRRACKAKFLADELETIASNVLRSSAPIAQPSRKKFSRDVLSVAGYEESYTLLEYYMLDQLSQILKVDRQELDTDSRLSSLGIDSLKAAELKNRLDGDLELDLPMPSFFQDSSLHELLLEILDALREAAPFQKGPALVRVPDEDTYHHLSFNQEQLWFLDQLEPQSSLYNIPVALRLQGELDVRALERSVNTIIERHDSLRTTFENRNGSPVQHVAEPRPIQIPVLDLRSLPDDERESKAFHRATEEAHLPFDLTTGPLLRLTLLQLAANDHVLLMTIHHSIADEWSLGVFFEELSALYEDPDVELYDVPLRYRDFSSWQRHLLYSEYAAEQLSYWKQKLQDLPILEIPIDHPRPPVQSHSGRTASFTLSEELTAQLKQVSRQEGVTLFMTLLASFQILLARYSGQRDIVVGTPSANRSKTDLEGLIGYFVNMLVLRTDLSGSPGFLEVLERVRTVCLEAYSHADLPFRKFVEELQPQRDLSRNPLFQIFFTVGSNLSESLVLPGLEVTTFEWEKTTAKFDLGVSLVEGMQGLNGSIEYSTDLFEEATIVQLIENWQVLLKALLLEPERSIETLPILTQTEQETLLTIWNATESAYPGEKPLHELVEMQAQRTPDSIAVVFESEYLTYQALNEQANRVAHRLVDLGVQPETPVGLFLERSLDLVVGLLAILKAGGVYLPLEPTYPQERLSFLLEDAQPIVILTQEAFLTELPSQRQGHHLLCLDLEPFVQQSAEPIGRQVSSDQLAYIIYTSGSTGRPKGVQNTHRAISNRLHWMQQQWPLQADDRVAQKTPFSFDASLWELFVPLLAGASVVLAQPGGHQDTGYLVSFVQEQAITVLQLVPSLLQAVLQEEGFAASASLRRVFCGGEKLSLEVVQRFSRTLSASLINLYGPTEASIDATSWSCDAEADFVPIGRPIANTQIYLLDEQLAPVPHGASGQLYIGGSGLARGYLHRPDLTAERFIPHPFSEQPGQRLYDTGDKARYHRDGLIEYLGREDQQVKIRGYRIELGEIEAHLAQHPAVRQVVVVVHENQQHQPQLVAYVQLHEKAYPQTLAFHHFLFERLPYYMIPSHYVQISSLPRLTNGKIDYKALPEPTAPPSLTPVASENSLTPEEALLEDILKRVLGVDAVSKQDNFFALGGHSLLATKVISQLRERIQVSVPLRLLFEAPTIGELAQRIQELRWLQTASLSALPDEEREEGSL
ncbi:non-ribosomal peptide synthetase [Tengunoibacter tsumagoiensis]|uniref:Carrier domain-containing protein n=1 Tax=Tengunoibacter tsumagoiensis TaxID=2014871 RepID=A0A402A5V6_9CHLR|nr:non-ribosomal peptide synthetase [Tengunoibacter tsumagoiensis]GCE14527.1 hypothetical protein KTT_43860 [Tengunoibacter tsumagoiensis]